MKMSLLDDNMTLEEKFAEIDAMMAEEIAFSKRGPLERKKEAIVLLDKYCSAETKAVIAKNYNESNRRKAIGLAWDRIAREHNKSISEGSEPLTLKELSDGELRIIGGKYTNTSRLEPDIRDQLINTFFADYKEVSRDKIDEPWDGGGNTYTRMELKHSNNSLTFYLQFSDGGYISCYDILDRIESYGGNL